MSKYVLVTGGAGYIGSHTVVALVENGYTPIILDDFRNANRIVLEGLTKILGFLPEIIEVDVCDDKALRAIFQKYSFEGIIHFAAYKAVGESVQNPLKYYQNNLSGLINILNKMLEFGVKNLVFSSSCTVYGEPKEIKEVSEDSQKNLPSSPYGYTKWIGEQIMEDAFLAHPELCLINLRYFNPVGAHKSSFIGEFPLGKPSNLLPFVTQTAVGKQDFLTVFGNDYPTRDGTCIRDYIHVMDLAEGHVAAVNYIQNKHGFSLFNLGTGKGTSVLELIDAFENATKQNIRFTVTQPRSGDIASSFANPAKAMQQLKWMPKRGIAEMCFSSWKFQHLNMK